MEVPGTPTGEAPRSALEGFALLGVVTFLTFWMRFVLADQESYWLDELFSVEQYVVLAGTVGEAIRSLAETSVHPPVYQFLLYYWVEFIGSTETATRTLSNLFVTVAVVVLHRLVGRAHGRGIANATAIVFALCYAVTFFGLETRSYAQTMLLVVLSSFALMRYLQALQARDGVRRLWPGWPAASLLGANVALLLTHYYNLFYWASQAVFAALLLVVAGRHGDRFSALPALITAYLFQLIIFLLVWGETAYVTLGGHRPGYEVDTPENTPLAILASATEQTFDFGPVGSRMGLLLIIALVVWRVIGRRRSSRGLQIEHVASLYSLWMTAMPAVMAYLVFVTIDAERFSPRYFVYLVPHIAVLGVLGASHGVARALDLLRTNRRGPRADHLRRFGLLYTLGLVTLFVIPGTVNAATHDKTDWRGMGQDVVSLVRSDPEHDYAIYQTSFRSIPLLDHYLRRFSEGEITATGVIQRSEEAGGSFAIEEDDWSEVERRDRLIVVFAHHSTEEFPIALSRLEGRYAIHQALLDDTGRGLVIFDLTDPRG